MCRAISLELAALWARTITVMALGMIISMSAPLEAFGVRDIFTLQPSTTNASYGSAGLRSMDEQLLPVGFLSVGRLNPYDLLVDPNRINSCPDGSEAKQVIAPRSMGNIENLDFPLYVCEQSVSGDGRVLSETNDTEKLVFGGVFGNYKDYNVQLGGAPLRYNNPYTGTAACAPDFETYLIHGVSGRDWALVSCFKRIPVNEESPYKDLRYHGIFGSPSECPGDSEAHKIFGSNGSPISDGDFDLPLYVCVEDVSTDGPHNGVAQVLDLKLLGMSGGTDANPTELRTLQNGDRIPYDIAPNLPYFSVKANVAFMGNPVNDDFPQNPFGNGQIPFRILIGGTRNGEPVRQDFRIKFAPYTIGSHNEDEGFLYQWTAANLNAVGQYRIYAQPIMAESDEPLGDRVEINFEIYDPDSVSLDPDITPPTTPTGLSITSTTSSQICTAWNASTDPAGASNELVTGVQSYDIYLNGDLNKSSSETNSCATGLSPEATYSLAVRAVDGAGNTSAVSGNVSGTTDTQVVGNSNLPADGRIDFYDNKWVNEYGYTLMGERDADGFHIMNILPGKRIVYVSNGSNADDSNSGYSKSDPIRTLDRANEIASNSDNNVQAVLLRRGDEFFFNGNGNKFRVNGPAADAPFYLAAYTDSQRSLADDRPLIRVTEGKHGLSWANVDHQNRAIIDLEFAAEEIGEGKGIRMVAGGDSYNLLIENCVFRDFIENLDLEGGSRDAIFRNLILHRNIIKNAQSNGRLGFDHRTQGYYVQNVNGLYMKENLIYNNGRHNHPAYIVNGKKYSSVFSHNGYLQYETRDGIAVNNISALGGSHGMQLRGGGDIVSNLFLRNPIAALIGHDSQKTFDDGTRRAPPQTGSTMLYNVALDGYDIHPEVCVGCAQNNSGPRDVVSAKRGWCFQSKLIKDARIEQNMCLQQKSGTQDGSGAISFSANGINSEGRNMSISKNLAYKWRGGDGDFARAFDAEQTSTYGRDPSRPAGPVNLWNNFWDGPITDADDDGYNFGSGSNANQSAVAINPNINYDLEAFVADINGAATLEQFFERLEQNWDKDRWGNNLSTEEMIIRVRDVYSEFLPQP